MASITDRGNGTFLVRVYNGVKNGKPQSVAVTFKANAGSSPAVARRAAEKYAALFEELVHSGGYERKPQANTELRARRRIRLEDFVQQYYYPSIAKHLSPNTCRTYEQIIDNLILPSFGMVELEDIDSTHLQNFVDFLSTADARATGDRGLSPASVKRYATVFCSVITEAWKQKFIEVNPFEHKYISYPKIVQPKLEVYSDDEIAHFTRMGCGKRQERWKALFEVWQMIKLRSVRQAVREIQESDPCTAMTETLFKRLIHEGDVSYTTCGARELIEMETLGRELSALFGCKDAYVPKMRTVRTAAKDIRNSDGGNAITEYRIRMLIRNGKMPCYEAGTRQIVALESFDDKTLFTMQLKENVSRRDRRSQSVCLSEQFETILSDTTQKYVCRRKR